MPAELISVIDSYFSYVRGQLKILDAQVSVNGKKIPQPVGTVVQARDWPLTPPIEGALYLLVQSIVPVEGGTQSQIHYQFVCQWTWLLIGQDIPANGRMENRGDRHRASLQIMTNLRQANFPCYCQKFQYTVDEATGELIVVPAQSVYPESNVEMVRWDFPRFISQPDEPSGLSYGVAAVNLYGWDDVNALVA
jgi:hypothetical protein